MGKLGDGCFQQQPQARMSEEEEEEEAMQSVPSVSTVLLVRSPLDSRYPRVAVDKHH